MFTKILKATVVNLLASNKKYFLRSWCCFLPWHVQYGQADGRMDSRKDRKAPTVAFRDRFANVTMNVSQYSWRLDWSEIRNPPSYEKEVSPPRHSTLAFGHNVYSPTPPPPPPSLCFLFDNTHYRLNYHFTISVPEKRVYTHKLVFPVTSIHLICFDSFFI